MFRLFGAVVLALAAVPGEARLPFFGKKDYTPLVFFTVPRGLMPENDAVEMALEDIENELGVRVERLDVLRNPSAEASLALLTSKNPPFLYHRESCQTIHIPTTPGEEAASSVPTYVDKHRLRAWAKGRLLSPQVAKAKVKPPRVISQEETAMDQDELLEDMSLSPLQRKGKEAIKERTEQRSSKNAREES